MAEIASAFVTLIPSFKGGGAKIASQLGGPVDAAGKSSGKRFGNSMSTGIGSVGKRIFAPLALAAGAIGVGNFLKGAIGEARESQKVGAITAQVIKTTGSAAKVTAGQVSDLATAISNKTGIDDEAIQSASNLLLTFTNVRNEVGKNNDVFNQATQAATDMGAALGKSPRSSAIQLGKALNDPVKGITALTRVGVAFTAGQKDQIKTMVASGNTLGAQKVILGELQKEFGGTAEASATAGEKFKTTFANFKEAIGTAILPVLDAVLGSLTTFVGFLTTQVGPAVKSLGPIFKPIADGIKVFFEALGGGDVTVFGTFGKIGEVAYGIRDAFAAAFPVVKQFARDGLAALSSAGASIMASLGPVLKQLPGLFAQLLPVLTTVGATILSVFKNAFTQIGPLIASVANIVIGLFKLIAPAVQALIPVIGGFAVSLQGLASTLISAFTVIWPPIQRLIAGILVQLVPGLQAIFQVISTQVVPALRSFATAIAPIIAFLVDKLAPIVVTVFGVVMSVIKNAMKIIAGVIKVVTAVITGDWRGAWNGIKQIIFAVWGIIGAVIKGAFKVIVSLFKLNMSISARIWGAAWNAIKALAAAAWNGIVSLVSAALGKLKSAVSTGIEAVVGFFRGIPGKITGALGNLGGILLNAGGQIIQGLIDGIQGAFGRVRDTLSSLTSLLPDWKGPKKKDRQILTPAGKAVIEGFIDGIRKATPKVEAQLRGLTNKLRAVGKSGLAKSLADENAKLSRLADARTKITGRLAAASKHLLALQKQAADYAAQAKRTVLATGDVTAQHNGSAFDIVGGLRKAVVQARAFAAAISKLRKGGLNKTSLSQIIAAGPEGGLGTARNILAQGSIKAINSLTGKLGKAGKSVGAQGAAAMFGAGIQAARGLVRGLRSQESALTAVMKRIALSLVRQVKKALGIHSPSKVMADLAQFIPLGMVQGIESQSNKVDAAMRNLTTVRGHSIPFNPQGTAPAGQGGIHIGTVQGYTAVEVAAEIDRKTRQRETLAFAGRR